MTLQSLRARKEWQFFAVLPRADAGLTIAWWLILIARGMLPAFFAIAMGRLVSAVQQGTSLAEPLTLVGIGLRAAPDPRADPSGRSARTSAIAPRRGSTTASPRRASVRPASVISKIPS